MIRTYSKNSKLIFLEKNNEKYSYTYTPAKTHIIDIEDADHKITTQTIQEKETVKEELLEKTLAGGAKAIYQEGAIEQILMPDNSVLSNIQIEGGSLKTATLTHPDGSVKIFNSIGILEEIDTPGNHLYFDKGRLSKIESPDLGTLELTYDLDKDLNPQAIWMKTANDTQLKYDSNATLMGLKLEGVATPTEILESATHDYQGGSNGSYSYDGNFNTAQIVGVGTDLFSTHAFTSPQTVTQFTYRMDAYASSSGDGGNGTTAWSTIMTQDATTLQWTNVADTVLFQTGYNGGGGGSSSIATTPNPATVSINLSNVIAVRANTGTRSSDNPGGYSAIWEIQFTLADQSFMAWNSDAQEFRGVRDVLLPNSIPDDITSLTEIPFKDKINNLNPQDFPIWQEVLKELVFDSSLVTLQEYSSDGLLEVRKKPDNTYTLFHEGKPRQVMDERGTVLLEYTYDTQGNIQRVYLKNARDALPDEIKKSRLAIEEQRESALLALAREKGRIDETIQAEIETQKNLYQIQLSDIQNQYDRIAGLSIKGKEGRAQKSEVLSTVHGYIDQINGYLLSLYESQSEAHANLDTQIKEQSDQIEANAETAFTALADQETILKKDILRQEVSPIVYDTYRRILGRDPSSQEYDEWIDKIDYDSGQTLDEAKTLDGINLSIALNDTLLASQELADRQAYVNAIKQSVTDQIQNYLQADQRQKTLILESLNLTRTELVSLSQRDAQKILSYIQSRSLHFGQSAFLALESLLDQNHITYDRQDLATKAILIDILTGVITPLDDGDLVISMYALNKVASLYSLSLSGANLSWDDLKNIYDSQGTILEERAYTETLPGSSIQLDGSGDYLSLEDSGDWTLSGDFTIDFWTRFDSTPRDVYFIGQYGGGSAYWIAQYYDGKLGWGANSQNFHAASWTPEINTWYHLAFVATGNSLKIYVNGAQVGQTITIPERYDVTSDLSIGQLAGYDYLNGQLDALRISKGITRWTENFTPSTVREETPDNYTKLLLGSNQNEIKDLRLANPRTITLHGNASINTNTFAQGIQVQRKEKYITQYSNTISNPDSLTDEDKQDIINNPDKYNPRIIAHINGDHYVIITSITDDSITYIDPGMGKDRENETITISKEGFLKTWDGNITAEESLITQESHLLSAQETRSLRGAGLPPWLSQVLSIAGMVMNIIAPGSGIPLQLISAAISLSNGDWMGAISSALSAAFVGLGSSLGNMFKGAFSNFTQALGPVGEVLKDIGTTFGQVYQSVSGFFTSAIGFLPGIGPALQGVAIKAGTTVGAEIVNTALSAGLTIGVSKGLEFVGINPQLSSFLGQLTSGAVMGAMKGETKATVNGEPVTITRAQHIQDSMNSVVTLNQVGRLGMELGLDSGLTNIVGLSLAAIQGQYIDGTASTLSAAFTNIRPELFSSLAQYGIDKLSTSFGVPSIVGQAIGAPISNVLLNGNITGQNIVRSVQEGLFNGAIAYAADFASDKITDNTVLNALSTRVISGAIEGTLIQRDTFKGVYDSLKQSVLGVFQVNQTLLNAVSFNLAVTQNGLSNALEIHLTNIFNRQSVESIQRSGGVASALASPKELITMPDGVSAQLARVSSGEGVLFDSNNNLLGFERNGIYQTGTFGIGSDGNFGLTSGKSFGMLQNGSYYEAVIQNGNVVRVKTITNNPSQMPVDIKMGDSIDGIHFDSDGNVTQGEMTLDERVTLTIANGTLDGIQILENASHLNPVDQASAFSASIFQALAEDAESQDSSSNIVAEIKKKLTAQFIFGNGFENERREEDTPDPLIESYVKDLEGRTPADSKIIDSARKLMFYLYEMTDMVFNAVDWFTDFEPILANNLLHIMEGPLAPTVDTINFFLNFLATPGIPEVVRSGIEKINTYLAQDWGINNNLVQEVMKELDQKGPIEDGIAFVHSGATAPLLRALQYRSYDIQTVLIYEGPHPDYNETITNPNLDRIIHVRGTGSMDDGDSLVPFLDWAHFGGVDNINIEIEGAFHSDYAYQPEDYELGGEFYGKFGLEREILNRKVNLFMRDLYEAVLTDQTRPGDLRDFFELLKGDGAATEENGIWKIDPDYLRDIRVLP